jgi:hypothetical protein
MDTRATLDENLNSLIGRIVTWAREHDRSFQQTMSSLCDGSLPEKTAKSLRAILYGYPQETVLVASQFLTETEATYGPIPDHLEELVVVRTNKGYSVAVKTKD